jgi:hemolysin activation/secretion protein
VNKDSASSVGVGARWNWQRRLDASVDLAYVLNGIADSGTVPGTRTGDSKLMFTLFYRF